MKRQKHSPKRRFAANRAPQHFEIETFFGTLQPKSKIIQYRKKRNVFVQGDAADSVFYIQEGRVKLTVTSEHGKAAIIGVLNGASFFGEGCIAGQPLRMMTASTVSDCALFKIDKAIMIAALHKNSEFADFFTSYVLARNIRYERHGGHAL